MDLSINFKNKKNNLNWYPIHTQKINFFLNLNYLIRNLQEIRKILKLKYSKNLKLKPKLKAVSIFECLCLVVCEVPFYFINKLIYCIVTSFIDVIDYWLFIYEKVLARCY